MIDVDLWKAVALSCNIEPRQAGLWEKFHETLREFEEGSLRYITDEQREAEKIMADYLHTYRDRLDIAKSHLSSGRLRPAWINVADVDKSGVNLALFAAWANHMQWDIPAELAGMAAGVDSDVEGQSQSAASERPTDSTDKPASKKAETASLNIIGALCELYWREIRDADDRDIVQAKIIERIVQEFPGVSGLSERNLKEKLSAAIRAVRGTK
jgi:hypothetical protein